MNRKMTLAEARAFALSLPGAVEKPHFEYTSFRVRGRIFATAPPEGDRLHVFVDEHAVGVARGIDPEAFEELHWGKKLVGVAVDLARADSAVVCELLEESWRRRAPSRAAARMERSAERGPVRLTS